MRRELELLSLVSFVCFAVVLQGACSGGTDDENQDEVDAANLDADADTESPDGFEDDGGADTTDTSEAAESDTDTIDAGSEEDAEETDTDPDGDHCETLQEVSPEWLIPFQQGIVAALSGAAEIAPGQVLKDRFTQPNRDAVRNYLSQVITDLSLEPEIQSYVGGANVYVVLEATRQSDEYILLGAHFDGILNGPGANDNATGVALVAAVAKTLAGLSCRTRNVIFAFFDQEEFLLYGSHQFARMVNNMKLNIIAVHTVDQMGWDEDRDRAVELELPDDGLLEFYEDAVRQGAFNIPLIETTTAISDHASFREYNYPSVGLSEEYKSGDTTPYYHKSTDTYETVNFAYLQSTTALVNLAFANLLTQ